MRAAGVRIALVGIMAAALLTACDNGEPRTESLGLTHAPADLSELEGGAWVTNHVTAPDVDTLVSGTEIEMHFKTDSISVNAGCNTMFGSASIEGDELVVPTLASTQKACADDLTTQDAWLTNFLSSRPTIEVLEQELWLSKGDDTVVHLFQE
jgi:heat shock protein HslJ